MTIISRIRTLGVAAAALALFASPTPAATQPNEGTVVWYSSVDTRTLNTLVDHFQKLHPEIKLQALQVGSSMIPARAMTEHESGKVIADLVSGDDFSLRQLAASGVLQPYRVRDPEHFGKGTVDPAGLWTTLYNDTTVIAFNPQKLKADGLKPPTSLADLAKPEWNGKIAIDASAYNWYSGTLKTQVNGEELLKRLAANHPFITNGHTITVTQLEAGEFDATPTAYAYMVEMERQRGRPVDAVAPKPVIVGLVPIGMMQGAPHPNAARVVLDWLLSKDGQQYFVDVSGRTSARTDVHNNPRVFDPKQPYYVLPAPDRNEYKTLIGQFRQLLGMNS